MHVTSSLASCMLIKLSYPIPRGKRLKSVTVHISYYDCNIITLELDHKIVSGSFLVLTIDDTDTEGVACPQDQSRAAITLIRSL